MIKCIIVDDEPLARDILEEHISKTPALQLVNKCANALQAFELLSQYSINLIFLDIKMPGINGIDFIKSLKKPPSVIFTTAFSEHGATSYELEAIDYLLKPVTYERFSKSIAKYLKLKPEVLVPAVPYTYFKVNGKLIKILHDEIVSAQSIKDYIIISTIKGNYITHMTMKYLAQLLPETLFNRVHRSFIVGLRHITAISKNEIALGDVKIPVGEKYRKDINNLMTVL